MIDIQRRANPPTSLAKKKKYDGPDVLLALREDFLEKCYLCETPITKGTFTVDHRKPVRDKQWSPELEFEWTNLFPACNKYSCNGRRGNNTYPPEGLLSPGDGVEEHIEQTIVGTMSPNLRGGGEWAVVFRPSDPMNAPAKNTAIELDRIHNATDSRAIDKAESLRNAIRDHLLTVAVAAMQYMHEPTLVHRERIQRFLTRRAPYAALVRNYFAKVPSIVALFD